MLTFRLLRAEDGTGVLRVGVGRWFWRRRLPLRRCWLGLVKEVERAEALLEKPKAGDGEVEGADPASSASSVPLPAL